MAIEPGRDAAEALPTAPTTTTVPAALPAEATAAERVVTPNISTDPPPRGAEALAVATAPETAPLPTTPPGLATPVAMPVAPITVTDTAPTTALAVAAVVTPVTVPPLDVVGDPAGAAEEALATTPPAEALTAPAGAPAPAVAETPTEVTLSAPDGADEAAVAVAPVTVTLTAPGVDVAPAVAVTPVTVALVLLELLELLCTVEANGNMLGKKPGSPPETAVTSDHRRLRCGARSARGDPLRGEHHRHPDPLIQRGVLRSVVTVDVCHFQSLDIWMLCVPCQHQMGVYGAHRGSETGDDPAHDRSLIRSAQGGPVSHRGGVGCYLGLEG